MDGDLLVTADTEGSDGVAGLACGTLASRSLTDAWRCRTVDGALAAQLLEHLSSSGQSVARFTD
jgi:hypothetical protein